MTDKPIGFPPLKVLVCDMSEDDETFAKKTIFEAFDIEREERKIAAKIKYEFDKNKSKQRAS
jgi:hypothetical protein